MDPNPPNAGTNTKRRKRERKRERKRSLYGSHHLSWLVVIALTTLVWASSNSNNASSWTDGSFGMVLAMAAEHSSIDDGNSIASNDSKHSNNSNINSNSNSNNHNDDKAQPERKPYRSTYGGRIKLVPNRKIIVVTTTEELNRNGSENTTPWKKNKGRGRGETDIESLSSPKLSSSTAKYTNNNSNGDTDQASPTLWTTLAPFVKRGLLLVALTAVAIVDRSPPAASSVALLPSASAVTATALSASTAIAGTSSSAVSASASVSVTASVSSWSSRLVPFANANLRLDWNKLYGLPGEVLPSLSAALMIAWIPNMILQKAWWELGFLCLSMTSQAHLRNYLLSEVLPSMGGTVRKLFWSEFWKQSWDFLLEPFSHNFLVPTKPSTPAPEPGSDASWSSKWQWEVSQFWSDKVVNRIDKWTASSVKALLQKNVQASVNGLAEDSWKAMSIGSAWYPSSNVLNRAQTQARLPLSSEDTARMIELECDDGNTNGDCEDEFPAAMVENDEAKETIAEIVSSDDSSEGSANDCEDDEDSSDSSTSFDESEIIEEPQTIRN